MKDLIRSLEIIQKHIPFRDCRDGSGCWNQQYPTHCEHDVLMVPSINGEVWDKISDDEKKELDALGWDFMDEYDCIGSFRFGSC